MGTRVIARNTKAPMIIFPNFDPKITGIVFVSVDTSPRISLISFKFAANVPQIIINRINLLGKSANSKLGENIKNPDIKKIKEAAAIKKELIIGKFFNFRGGEE